MKAIAGNQKFSKLNLTIFAIIVGFVGAYLIFASHAATVSANIWVDEDGGSCTWHSTPATYNSAEACGSFNAAYQIAHASDVVSVKPKSSGSYPSAFATISSRAGLTADTDFSNNVSFVADGNVVTDRMVIGADSGNRTVAVNMDGFHVIGGQDVKNVDDAKFTNMESNDMIYMDNSTYITWSHILVQPNGGGAAPFSNGWGMGLAQQSGNGGVVPHDITVDHLTMHGVRATAPADHPDGIFTWKTTGGTWDNIVIKNSKFYDNECTNLRTDRDNPTNLTLENNYFGAQVNGISGCGYFSADIASANLMARYNTFETTIQNLSGSVSNSNQTWIGNAFTGGFSNGCSSPSTDYSYNVFTGSKCGGTTNKLVADLKLNSDGTPQATSPLIGAGDPSNFPQTDITDATRVSPPDAGAYKYGATSSGTAAPVANLWIDPSGGNCTRSATQSTYVDAAACSSMQAAVAASQPGDTIRMKVGTYGGQTITTNSTSPGVSIIAEDGTSLTGSLSTLGDWVTVQNVHAAGGGFSDVGGGHPFNVTWKNIDMTGGIVFIDGGTNFTWQGGSLHDNSVNNEGHLVLQGIPPDCAQGASQCSNDLSNVVIDGIRFYNLTRNATCIQSSCHNEVIRIDNGAHDITIKNNTFGSGNDPNSALIFTGDKGYGANEYNITLEQNFFGSSGSAYYAFDASQCIGLKLNYNTFAGSHPHFACTDATSVKVVGNTGTHPAGCATGSATITWDHNVWSDAACGGTDTGNATLAFAADGFHITSASGAIKNGSSTYCPATDIDGDTRPSAGSACDAGADQYSSSTTTTPPPTGDTTAPTVSLTAPTGGASVSGSVSLTATASDNVGVVGVQFKVDGTAVGSEDTSSPYSVTWSSAAVANGSHSITATARDAAGNTKTSTAVSVTVSNAAAPSGTVLLGNQTVETNADSDPPGTAEAFRYTAVASGSAGQLVLYLAPDNAATSVKLGLYSDNAGHPGSLLASGTVTSPSPGTWNTVNFTTPPSVTAGSNYWVGLLGTGGTVSFRNQATGSCSESASTTNLTSLPATWTTGPVWSNCQLSAYVLATSTSTPPPADSTAPTTSLTNPTSGASVSGTTTVTASASDNVAVTKVDFYLDGALIASDTTAPYSFGWTTTASSNGSHSLQSKAYDAASNTGSSSVVTVTVNNGDSTPPTAPTGLTASATGPTSVDLSWSASSDNVGVTKYYVLRNGAVIASVTAPATSYSDNTAVAATSYSYQVTAADAASNTSTASNSATVTTPAPPDTTAPAAPGNLTATAVSPSQVNLAWSASSDPSGISRYDVYRNGQLLTSTKTTSLADATASAGASYSYTVKAIDGAGNTSAASNTATVTMPAPQPATQTLSATPTDDSYVSRRKPNANYGNSSVIRADVSPELTGLYKFSVSGIGTKSVVSAKLRLYVSDGSDQGGQLYRLTSSNWSQATVTYTSRPTADTTSNLASLGKTVSGSWLEVDLTSLVTHDGSYGLQLTTPSSNTAGYASKETSSKPVLVVGVQ